MITSAQLSAGPPTRIVLVRHGHVEGIAPLRFRGRTDLPLTEQGLRQAEITRNYLANAVRPDAIYTSPLSRCVRTGEVISQSYGASTSTLEAFIDIDFGWWQGKTYAEVQATEPENFMRWRRTPQFATIPGGESLYDAAARVAGAARMILDRHHGQTVVLVGHDGVNCILLLLALDLPLSRFWHIRQDPCAISILDHDDSNGWVVQSINETVHLSAAKAL